MKKKNRIEKEDEGKENKNRKKKIKRRNDILDKSKKSTP